jgi:hypothetical protein
MVNYQWYSTNRLDLLLLCQGDLIEAYGQQKLSKLQEYQKRNRQQKRENIKEYQKGYQKIYQKEYREKNKKKHSEKYDCCCGGRYTAQNKTSHLKTNLHQSYLLKSSTKH